MDNFSSPKESKRKEEKAASSPLSSQSANELLSYVANMMAFDTISLHATDKPQILQETAVKITNALSFKQLCFYLVDEETALFHPAYCAPETVRTQFEQWIDVLIDDQTFAWALNRNKAVRVEATSHHPTLILHSIATVSRIRGMFIGVPASDFNEESHLTLLTLLLHACANHIESLELYTMLRKVNSELKNQVAKLEGNEQELLQHRERLEELVADRTHELAVAREQAERSASAKGQFLANMSHEIRTPLNAMIGITGILMDSELDPQQQDYAVAIQESSENLLYIINDILDFSKIEAGELKVEKISYNLGSVIDGVCHIFGPQIEEKKLAFNTIINDDVPLQIMGDPLRVKQVFTNLLSNAIKFTDQGRVAITVEKSDSRQLKISVSDSGIGIPEAACSRLFQSFSQVDSSTSRRYGGTGLGLAISKQLVELMGGSIGVDSDEGEGSCFWFALPLEEAPFCRLEEGTVIMENSEKEPSGATAGTILLVEDVKMNQLVACKILEKKGYQVAVADDGCVALEMLKNSSYDLVLMDCQMPEMDGFTATKHIRSELKLTDLPIIAMTANAMAGDRDLCLAAGMDDYVSKPIVPAVLFGCIERWLPSSVTSPASDEKVFDATVLDNLLGEDNDLKIVVVDAFLDDLDTLLVKIYTYLEDENRDEAEAALHALKGLCGNVGANRLQGCAARYEQQVAKANSEQLNDMSVVLKEQQSLSVSAVNDYKTRQ